MDPVTLPSAVADFYPFPLKMFKMNRDGLVKRVRADKTLVPHSLIVLEGGHDPQRFDSDYEPLFRQESHFNYCFGVQEPNFYGVLDIDSGKSILFPPRLAPSWAIWLGRIPLLDEIKEHYGVDEVYYSDELQNYLKKFDPAVIYLNHGQNNDSDKYAKPAEWPGKETFRCDNGLLYYHVCEARVHKNEEEIKLMRYVNRHTCDAHLACMKTTKPGMYEFQVEATFLHVGYYTGGCRLAAYTSICGCGCNSSILHYGHSGAPNNRLIKDNDWICSDQGVEMYGYTSDVTCTFPANGKYTPQQKLIYETVFAMNDAVQKSMKPGVNWRDLHALSYKVGLEKLTAAGLLHGNVADMMKINLCATFMPHGLGHLMGCDTHDVGGYNRGFPERLTLDGYKSLRTSRDLESGMVITVEPGIYFIVPVLEAAYADPEKAKFMNKDVIDAYIPIGGCRIEDDMLVTEDGAVNLTNVPRTIEDVEAFCQGKSLYRKDIKEKFLYIGD